MAILDGALLLAGTYGATNFLNPQLITAVGTTNGSNVVDLQPAANGQVPELPSAMPIEITITQTLTSAGAATVQFQLVEADDQALATNVQVLTQSAIFPFAALTAGQIVNLSWRRAAPFTPRRYAGLQILIAGAALTNATGWLLAAVGAPGTPTQKLPPILKTGYSVL